MTEVLNLVLYNTGEFKLPKTFFDLFPEKSVVVLLNVGVPEPLIKAMNSVGLKYERVPEMMTRSRSSLIFVPKSWEAVELKNGYFTGRKTIWVAQTFRTGLGNLVRVIVCELSDKPVEKNRQMNELINIRNAAKDVTTLIACDSQIESYQEKLVDIPFEDAWFEAGTPDNKPTRSDGSRRERIWLSVKPNQLDTLKYETEKTSGDYLLVKIEMRL